MASDSQRPENKAQRQARERREAQEQLREPAGHGKAEAQTQNDQQMPPCDQDEKADYSRINREYFRASIRAWLLRAIAAGLITSGVYLFYTGFSDWVVEQTHDRYQVSRYLVKDFGTSKSPKSTRKRDSLNAPAALRPCRFTTPSQARRWFRNTTSNG